MRDRRTRAGPGGGAGAARRRRRAPPDRRTHQLETPFEARADTLVEMVRRGYAEQMVLSQDASCYIDWVDPEVMAFLPQWHYTHLFDDVFPYVLDRGVTQAQLDTMLVDVPRGFFEAATVR